MFSYPQLATIAGVLGVVIYALASALPLLSFAWLGSIIRKKCPNGFILTQFVKERFGLITSLTLSFFSLVTMFVYMIAELSAISQVINTLTGLNGLGALVVECFVTSAYTAYGGFRTSLITDNIQGVMVTILLIICAIAIGTQCDIQESLIQQSGLVTPTLISYQLIYIFPIAIVFNDYFLAGFWQRSFASKTDKDLWRACIGASIFLFILLFLIGFTGLIAAWSGVYPGPDDSVDSSVVFFALLNQLPSWIVGFVIVFAIALSCSAYDTLLSAMVSTASNDFFQNKIPLWVIRVAAFVINVPVIIMAIRNVNILEVFLIADLLSACVMPPILLGLIDHLYFVAGFEVIIGLFGGILSVFIFGTIYYGSAQQGANLLLLKDGLYADDWSAFGAFVAAPVGSLLFTAAGHLLRALYCYIRSRTKPGYEFTVYKRREINVANFADPDMAPIESSNEETSEENKSSGEIVVEGELSGETEDDSSKQISESRTAKENMRRRWNYVIRSIHPH